MYPTVDGRVNKWAVEQREWFQQSVRKARQRPGGMQPLPAQFVLIHIE